jgi:beta-N-acetylhexosaminidase
MWQLFQKKIIQTVIRKKIGFKGILMSDDISMKALKFDLLTNAKKSLERRVQFSFVLRRQYK